MWTYRFTRNTIWMRVSSFSEIIEAFRARDRTRAKPARVALAAGNESSAFPCIPLEFSGVSCRFATGDPSGTNGASRVGSMVQGIFFDLDGTLLEFKPGAKSRAARRAARAELFHEG